MKKGFLFVLVLALVSGMCLSFMPTPALATDTDDQTTASVATGNTTDKEYELVNGVNILKEGQDELTFNIKDGQALMISGQEVTDPLVFKIVRSICPEEQLKSPVIRMVFLTIMAKLLQSYGLVEMFSLKTVDL